MKKTSNKLRAICKLQNQMGKKEKEVLIKSFVNSNFNYCPPFWYFGSKKLMRKIEKIQERCLQIILNDYESSYDALLHKS